MPRDVNPSEPWRPRPTDPPVPPIDVHKPWRPRPAERAAPVPPPPEAPPPRPQAAPPRPSPRVARPQHEEPGRLRVLAIVLFLLVVSFVAVAILGGEHSPRIFLGCLALGMGWGASVSLAPRRDWGLRLACILGGVMAALAVRLFVPTVDGVSLFEAAHLAARIEALPTDDVAAYAAGAWHRKAAMKRFPEFAGEIRTAERAWLRRSADAAIEGSEAAIDHDPATAWFNLRLMAQYLSRLDHWAEVRDDLQVVRRRAVLARARTLAAGLERLADRGECEAVAQVAIQSLSDLHDEAREVGVWDEAAGCLRAVRTRALCLRLDAAVGQLEAAVGRGEFTAVARGGEKALTELSGEAREVGLEKEVRDRLLAVRRKAVLAALGTARRQVEALREKGRFQAITSLGEQLAGTLSAEARIVGAAAELEQFCQGCRTLGAGIPRAGTSGR